MIYITSDIHMGHDQTFIYAARGYNSIEEHDNDIITKWNNIVSSDDEVYILGDLMLGDSEKNIEKIKNLNGHKNMIIGNHDSPKRIELYNSIGINCLGYSNIIIYKKWRFYISHYPTICSNFSDGVGIRNRTWNLCGHTHTQDKFKDIFTGCIYHCELDAHNNAPIAIDNIIEDMKGKYA